MCHVWINVPIMRLVYQIVTETIQSTSCMHESMTSEVYLSLKKENFQLMNVLSHNSLLYIDSAQWKFRPSTNISTNHSTGQFKTTIEENWNFHRTGFSADCHIKVRLRTTQKFSALVFRGSFSSTYCHFRRPYLVKQTQFKKSDRLRSYHPAKILKI